MRTASRIEGGSDCLSPPFAGTATNEARHTTANHPWLTTDRGWVPAGELRAGEPVVTLDSGTAATTVASVRVVPGQADMYNLTVAEDHTYAVGDGRDVVHNAEWCGDIADPQSIGYTQDTISNKGGGYTVEGNINRLKADKSWEIPDKAGNYNAIRIFQKTGGYQGQKMTVSIRACLTNHVASQIRRAAITTIAR